MFCSRKASWITALLFILLASEQVLGAPDYYKILGVSKNAKEDEIKKQYKKKSKIFHPDRNPGDKKEWAQKKFSELTDAYQTLKDPQKRELYDRGKDRYSLHFRLDVF
jgi:curved DNA-binding protein CbpA